VAVQEKHTSGGALDSGSMVADANKEVENAGEIRKAPVGRKATGLRSRWWIAAALAVAALCGGAWWTFQSKPQALIYGSKPSPNHEANDQYNLAMNFLTFQNNVPLARKTFERALELDPNFASARLQHACMTVIEIFNGYTNDGSALYRAEEELHQAEQALPGSDGLLLSTQTLVYLAQGRLDRIPSAKLDEQVRKGGNPHFLVILRMLKGQTEEPLAIVRMRLERNALENPTRMLLGELLRTQGDAAGAIHTLERALEQAPAHPTAAWFLTMAYLDKGNPEQARALLEGMRLEFEKNYMWRHAWAILLAAEGKREEALQAMDEGTLKFARLTWTVTSTTADFYALQGDHSKAIEWLQLAIARGDERVSYFRRNPRLVTLRNDARFQSLLKSVEARPK
jgi:tetratricopeptide (TPR) repeat protein